MNFAKVLRTLFFLQNTSEQLLLLENIEVKKRIGTKYLNPSRPVHFMFVEIKINLNFIFTLLCDASKGFAKALKAFIKTFQAPQRSVKIKNKLIFSLHLGSRRILLIMVPMSTANIKLTAGVDIFQRRKITLVLTDNVARLNSRFLSN